MTLVVRDHEGVWHEIYNKTEIAQLRSSQRDWVDNWQVRTLCCKDEEPEFLGVSVLRATIDDSAHTEHAPTCVRCAAMPCDHGVTFDEARARGLTANEIRSRWPRLEGTCKKGCGYHGVAYASFIHYVCGDW